MTEKDITTSIKSHEFRLEQRKKDAIRAIREGSYWQAQIALGECIGYEAVINEMRFQLEVMEVENV